MPSEKLLEVEQNFRRLHTHKENRDRMLTALREKCQSVPIYATYVTPNFPADPTPRPTAPPTPKPTFSPTPAPPPELGCADDPGEFPNEMRKQNLAMTSCKQVITFQGWNEACGDYAHLRVSMEKVCRESCGLCPSTTVEPVVVVVKGDGVISPLPLPGNIIKMSVNVDCESKEQRERMVAGINELNRDPRRYIRGLIEKLEKDKINDVPAQVWISVVSGPEVIYPAPPEPEDDGNSWYLYAALAVAIVLVGALAAVIVRKRRARKTDAGRKYSSSSPSNKAPESKEAWKSESQSPKRTGKTYRKKAPEEIYQPEPKSPAAENSGGGWMGRLWRSKSASSPEPPTVQSFDAADPADLVPGAEVRLFGLSKIEYNGLKGIVRGPAEKEGRFVIDVILIDSATVQEMQELSLKADNLKLIPQTARSP
jgi:hypothetical protein